MGSGPRVLEAGRHTIIGQRGTLFVLGQEGLPFAARRVFWIDGPQGAVRGGHAHRSNEQIVIPVTGGVEARCQWWDGELLTRTERLWPGRALYLPARIWLELTFTAPSGNCMVLASEPYDPASYIEDLDELRRLS